MKYLTPKEIAAKWGISQRRVHTLCLGGRIEGAEQHGWIWMIPETAEKPKDARIKTGRYLKEQPNLVMEQNQLDATYKSEHHIMIPRPHLIEKISSSRSKLIYIHAGVGYGKTTLLMQYAKNRQHTIWLSLRDRDNELSFFLHHLKSSIEKEINSFSFYFVEDMPFAGGKTFIFDILSALLQAIGDHKLTIIMDDVHVITNELVIDLLTQWVKVCPSNIAFIMASRYEIWSSLYKLKIAGEVAELGKEDLCFSQEEAEKLWGFFDADAYSATEGWILGMQSFRLMKGENTMSSMPKLHGNRELYSYMLNEILLQLPVEIQHFLKATSWLSVLEVAMCNDLLDIDNSQEILEKLISRNIFTLRMGDATYRYHTLFRNLLQQNDNGLGQETLKKAVNRCYGKENYEQAVDYALLLKDGDFIQDCINAILSRPFNKGYHWKLKKYIDFLEENHIELYSSTLLAKGMHLSDQGDFYEAEKYLSVAIPHLNKGNKIIYLHGMIHKARVLRNRVSFEESNDCIDSLLPLLENMSMEAWYKVVIEKIHNLTLTSQLQGALELTLTMMKKSLNLGAISVKSWFERYLTVIYFYMGDYKNCLKAYEKSMYIPQEEQDWLMSHCVGAYAAKAYQIIGQEEKTIPLLDEEIKRMGQLEFNEELSINYLLYAEVLHTTELLKLYEGKAADFSSAYRYLTMAEDYAFLNRSTHDHYIFVKVWKACTEILNHPEKAEQFVSEALTLMDGTTPFFKSLAYGRIASALDTLGQNTEQCKEYFLQSIKIGESVGSYAYATIAYGRMAAIYLREGHTELAKEYTRQFLEFSHRYGHYYYIRFKILFAPVLKWAEECDIIPEFTREMMIYGGYTYKRVYINTLGKFYIAPARDRKNAAKIRTKKACELLAYLLENRKGVTREQIFADLWWDSEANVSNLFHTRRGEIRKAFENMGANNPILHEGTLYRLNMDEIICDYDDFKEIINEFQQQATVEKAKIIVENYTGRYLNNMEAFWAEGVRLQLENSFSRASEFLLENHSNLGKQTEKVNLLKKINK